MCNLIFPPNSILLPDASKSSSFSFSSILCEFPSRLIILSLIILLDAPVSTNAVNSIFSIVNNILGLLSYFCTLRRNSAISPFCLVFPFVAHVGLDSLLVLTGFPGSSCFLDPAWHWIYQRC